MLPLVLTGRRTCRPGWPRWLAYFGCLGAGFMLIEVALLQRFVLLLGHPVYSLTVTLFSLLLGTGIGSALGRRIASDDSRRRSMRMLAGVALLAVFASAGLPPIIDARHRPTALAARIALAAVLTTPAGILMGMPLPAGIRLLAERHADSSSRGRGA